MTNARLLLIEDDPRLGDLVRRFLTEHDYTVDWSMTAHEAEKQWRQHPYDLIICDLMLPDAHGFTVQEKLQRELPTPVLFMTAQGSDEMHIEGLERGAIDYLIKPVDPMILLARVRAHLRGQARSDAVQRQISLTGLTLDAQRREVRIHDHLLDLTPNEFNLLWVLARHANHVLQREFLFEQAGARDYNGLDRTIDGRVSRLRKKLDAQAGSSWTIRTIWGKGYLLCNNTDTTEHKLSSQNADDAETGDKCE